MAVFRNVKAFAGVALSHLAREAFCYDTQMRGSLLQKVPIESISSDLVGTLQLLFSKKNLCNGKWIWSRWSAVNKLPQLASLFREKKHEEIAQMLKGCPEDSYKFCLPPRNKNLLTQKWRSPSKLAQIPEARESMEYLKDSQCAILQYQESPEESAFIKREKRPGCQDAYAAPPITAEKNEKYDSNSAEIARLIELYASKENDHNPQTAEKPAENVQPSEEMSSLLKKAQADIDKKMNSIFAQYGMTKPLNNKSTKERAAKRATKAHTMAQQSIEIFKRAGYYDVGECERNFPVQGKQTKPPSREQLEEIKTLMNNTAFPKKKKFWEWRYQPRKKTQLH